MEGDQDQSDAQLSRVDAERAAQDGKIHYNLAALVDRLPASKVPMQTFTTVEVEKLLDTFAEDRLGHVWHLALVGLRRGETRCRTTGRPRVQRRA